MYRANDPRFRRRLNEIGQTLESANESAQSNIYIFTQNYIKPCIDSIASGVATCIEASCPTLNLSPRERLRRQRGHARNRGHAEVNFDFYDDWDEEENDALLSWGGDDDLDRILAGSGSYGTVTQTQPARQRGMSYPKGRRKSAQFQDGGTDPMIIPGSSGILRRWFGGKSLRYKPSAAGLKENPGARPVDRVTTEGEALLAEHNGDRRRLGRQRSGTASSGQTTDSLSSRGDILPSDGEDDAIPLDDEFAMVLERRTTQSGGHEIDSSGDIGRRSGKRPSAGSRTSTSRHTPSSRSRKSNSSTGHTPVDEGPPSIGARTPSPPTMTELKQEERRFEDAEDTDIHRRRDEAQRLAVERGLLESHGDNLSSKEATPQTTSPVLAPARPTLELDTNPSGNGSKITTGSDPKGA